ncbi:hypothetical protein B7494_g5170 [Chlorociboria aeruginascens]|nr:hypothetical protein B7494_g5170 [Chlorociboria aeruginascens]
MNKQRSLYSLLEDEEKYASSEQSEDEIALQRNLENISRVNRKTWFERKFFSKFSGWVSIVLAVLITVPITVLVSQWLGIGSKTSLDQTMAWSPVMECISLPFHRQQIDSRLYPEPTDPTAIYQAPPSPEVDKAWNRIGDNMIFGISREEVIRVGKDPDMILKVNPEWDEIPSDLYMAEVDVFHQIHCLNSLRKALITNYDHYWGSRYGFEPPQIFDTHLRHCQSILLQSIMCHSDLEVITHIWQEDQSIPYPDFGVNKQCRDFNALLEWKEANDLFDSHHKFNTYKKPEGAVAAPSEPYSEQATGNATGFKHGIATKEIFVKGCNS